MMARACSSLAALALATSILGAAAAVSGSESATARSSASADLYLVLLLNGQPIPVGFSGSTVTVSSTNIRLGVQLLSNGPEAASGSFRLELPSGVRWETPPPASEGCSGDAVVTCDTGEPIPPPPPAATGFGWNLGAVIAPGPGTYAFRVEISASSATDPDTTNNAIIVNVAVQPTGGGGGGSAAAIASAAKVTPAKPKAGATVVATVRVTAGGAPVRPKAVACRATLGGGTLRGTPRAASGRATCAYRTPKGAKGRTLKGAVSFSAREKRFTKRFSAKLG